MVLILTIISILILSGCYLVYYKRKDIKINGPILILPSVLAGIIIFIEFSLKAPLDIRLVEYPAECIRHYPTWAETIICRDTISDYTVSHHEYYAMMYRGKGNKREEEKEIPETTYKYFLNLWADSCLNPNHHHTTEENLLSSRGYYRCKWDENMYSAMVYTKTEPYVNYLQDFLRIYNFEHISIFKADTLGLFPRARVDLINSASVLEPRQTLIYGLSVPDSISHACSYISTIDHDFRPIILVWEGRSDKKKLIEKQRSYWGGGKDNEVVFCVCIDDTTRRNILWSGSFSWAQTTDFEEYVLERCLRPGTKLNMIEYVNSLFDGYTGHLWKPIDISEFSMFGIPIISCLIYTTSLLIISLNILLIVKYLVRDKEEKEETDENEKK